MIDDLGLASGGNIAESEPLITIEKGVRWQLPGLTNGDGEPFRVCLACDPNHVENCTSCFGFGFKSEGVPLSASEVTEGATFIPCPECGGTSAGVAAAVGEQRERDRRLRASFADTAVTSS